jgi:hypothetical protein
MAQTMPQQTQRQEEYSLEGTLLGERGQARDLMTAKGHGRLPAVIGWGMGHVPRLTMRALSLYGVVDAAWQELGSRATGRNP